MALSGLIQLVVRCRAAFCPVMIEMRGGEHTLMAQKLLKRTPLAAKRYHVRRMVEVVERVALRLALHYIMLDTESDCLILHR